MTPRARIASIALLTLLAVGGIALAGWKYASVRSAQASAANQPEPAESVVSAVAKERQHRQAITSIGTVLALRSITLRNELAGTVSRVMLNPGEVVEAGTVLVALDTSVEEADLAAQEAQAELTRTVLARVQNLAEQRATSQERLDRARAEYNVAVAQVARTKAVIARKIIRAPFRARVGIADVHPGQYLNEGTELTTLQGVAAGTHIDFTVAQQVATGLRRGDRVEVFTARKGEAVAASIVAVDARFDRTTRNALVRASVEDANSLPAPGASVRVRVPVGAQQVAVAIPVSALRKGPSGDHVFVLLPDDQQQTRAHVRPVQVGAILGEEVIIEGGLTAGEQVAASGSFKLRDAGLVVITNAPVARTGADQ